MNLFDAVVSANQRAAAGDNSAGLRPADFESSLPVAALTCIDIRLNPLLPNILGLRDEDFIWLRNAGNIITSSLSSTMRSLALACAIKGAKEIAIIGHTDCRVRQTNVMDLTSRFQQLGIMRQVLPDNINEFFGLFASERQNVQRGVELVRKSPIISPRIPVHGLMVDIETGQLEWVVNGYQALERVPMGSTLASKAISALEEKAVEMTGFNLGEMKFPLEKIGEAAAEVQKWAAGLQLPSPPPKAPVADALHLDAFRRELHLPSSSSTAPATPQIPAAPGAASRNPKPTVKQGPPPVVAIPLPPPIRPPHTPSKGKTRW